MSLVFLVTGSLLAPRFADDPSMRSWDQEWRRRTIVVAPAVAPAVATPALAASTVTKAIAAKFQLLRGSVSVGLPMAGGAYGQIFSANYAGEAAIAKRARRGHPAALTALRSEAYLDAKLCEAMPNSIHLAPFLGISSIAGSLNLVWRRCDGNPRTLSAYLGQKPKLLGLATALGVGGGGGGGGDSRQASPTLSRRLARRVLRELLEALAGPHAQGVVHRDVKPDNLLVDGTRS